ncbi:hypothetical protein K788_00025100 [Paraburkholderia caribensis MBA4]|uniref:Uncharacterized protein n=1 Tax=Paraburkholderia caribensis MBA4 TaxID=1323664 RepID=A0A0P0R7L0_9BURK|nr:hypothetical protein K788_00025100 [Paraburkholderia caribensis MBA4]
MTAGAIQRAAVHDTGRAPRGWQRALVSSVSPGRAAPTSMRGSVANVI